ncbi:serine hydrolase domain-containing protein [Nonomuraea sp. LPB2021202275-12-8]|uniref:serine hydrolase domain-containing protein n=1 Tax=Nonomuraea sp. LPB2021202275-12-8 TaxID=3120159 RepID=UPI00300D520C
MTMADRVEAVLRAGEAPNLHGLVVLQHGRVVLERYGAGEDHKLGDSLGHVTFDAGTLHDVRSISKSVVALLYGIALKDGLVPEPGEGLVRQFPEYLDLVADPARAHLTIEHALTMTLGLEWDESAPYTSAANSEIAMEEAPDRHRYVLERPIVEEAGRRWSYCGGASALIGGIIAKGTGRPLAEYARAALFEPLGIGEFEWTTGRDGMALAAAGLRLKPRDLATIGTMVLDGGGGIVPGDWLDEVLRPRVPIGDDFAYGYQWYVDTGEVRKVGAHGNGGQRLYLVPSRELVVALTAGDYNDSTQPSTTAVFKALLG